MIYDHSMANYNTIIKQSHFIILFNEKYLSGSSFPLDSDCIIIYKERYNMEQYFKYKS